MFNFLISIFISVFPTAIATLPQLGSSPAIAVLTKGELEIEKQIFLHHLRFCFNTIYVTNLDAPSPSAATLLANLIKLREHFFKVI